MVGTLEGLESDYDSPGLGKRDIIFHNNPEVGLSFRWVEDNDFWHTSTIARVKDLPDGSIGFITRNTTYILKIHLNE